MRTASISLPILALMPAVLAAPAQKDSQTCTTQYGGYKGPKFQMPTYTDTKIIITSTSTQWNTVAPTTTITRTSTNYPLESLFSWFRQTLPPVTNLHSKTNLVTIYSTAITNTDVTVTRTAPAKSVTLAPTTTVIDAPADFTPAAQAMANVEAKRRMLLARRGGLEARSKATYPTAVFCSKRISQAATVTSTKTKPVVTVYTATTTRKIRYTTISQTNTITPNPVDVTKTLVSTKVIKTTSTKVATAISYTTPTVTVTPSPIPYYAACNTDNQLDYTQRNGTSGHVGIASFATSGTDAEQKDAADAYSCCVLCVTGVNCAGAYFKDGTCTLQHQDTCPEQSDIFGAFYASGTDNIEAGSGYTISNGLCGSWSYGGVA